MIDRNDYGFPLPFILDNAIGAAMIGYRVKPQAPKTKLERAQAIAADVRARKFPPVRRLIPKDE